MKEESAEAKIIGTLTVIVDPVTNDFELRVDGRSISGSSGHLPDGEVWFDDGNNLIDGIAVLVGKALIPSSASSGMTRPMMSPSSQT